MPELEVDPSWFQVDVWVVVLLAICLAAFVAFAVTRAIRAHQRQASAGKEDMIGKTAIVAETLEPQGTVLFKGERWTAVTEEGRVEPGEEVIITKIESLRLYVVRKQ